MRLFFTGPRVLGIRPGVSVPIRSLLGTAPRRTPGEPITGAFVYVVRGDHNMVKIGVTTNPDARLAQLRTGSAFPIEYAYLAVTPGSGYDIEQAAHSALASHRCHGEWFDVAPEHAVAAINGVAYRLEQPITAIPPNMAAQILRIAAQGPPQQPTFIVAKIAVFVGLAFVLIIMAILVSH